MIHGERIGDKVFLQPVGVNQMYGYSNDKSITLPLLYEGVLEYSLTRYIQNNLKNGMVFLDAGANIGYFTLLAGGLVGKSGKVYAYEASNRTYSLLFDNVSLNDMNDIISTKHCALYSEETVLDFHICNKYQGNNSIFKHDEWYTKTFADDDFAVEQVQAIALDNEDFPDIINIMKIDVEGAEYHVFKGMEKMLDNNRVHNIVFEYNTNMLKHKDELKKFLSSYNAEYYILDNNGGTVSVLYEDIFNQNEDIYNIVMSMKG